MKISLLRRSPLRLFARFVEREQDFWLLVVVPFIIALMIVFLVMAILLMPVAVEQKRWLEQQFQRNYQEAVQ